MYFEFHGIKRTNLASYIYDDLKLTIKLLRDKNHLPFVLGQRSNEVKMNKRMY